MRLLARIIDRLFGPLERQESPAPKLEPWTEEQQREFLADLDRQSMLDIHTQSEGKPEARYSGRRSPHT